MKLTLPISVLCAASLSLMQAANAQNAKSWEFGISGLTGRNFYDRKYYNQPELPPGREPTFKSNYLWAGNVWAERHLNQHISAIAELRYTEVDVPTNTLCECSYTDKSTMKYILSFSLATFILSCFCPSMSAQHKGLDLGISAMTGRNFYDKKYYNQDRLAPGWETNFKTNHLWSASIWAEKDLSPHFSTITEFRFMEEDVPENMLCQCNSVLEVLDTDEKHH